MSNLVADAFNQLSYLQAFCLIVFFRVQYLVVYRLYIHPLKSFPGPRLAAVTDFYQGYYASWKNGMFVRHLEELHRSMSSGVLRYISPHSGFTKDPDFYKRFGHDNAAFGMTDGKVNMFLEQLRNHKGEAINLFYGFQSLAMDIVTAYCYAHSFGGLTMRGFDHPIMRSVEGARLIMTATQYLPILVYCITYRHGSGGVDERNVEHETIYHHLITPELIKKGEVPSKKALIEEAMVLLVAGTDTTSNAMTVGLFHLLSDESAGKKLQAELQAAWPEKDAPFTFEMAEKLPYLTGVIKEALRLSIGVTVALPRVVTSTTVIDGVAVPAGTVVGISHQFVLRAPDIFPDPLAFKPERWMGRIRRGWINTSSYFRKAEQLFGHEVCLVLPSYMWVDRSSRHSLAWCELYLTFAHLVRKFDMQLYETSKEDMVFRDHIVPVWKDCSRSRNGANRAVIYSGSRIFKTQCLSKSSGNRPLEEESLKLLMRAHTTVEYLKSHVLAEKLPYLTGVIKEALRLSTGVPVPLPRIVTAPIVIDGRPFLLAQKLDKRLLQGTEELLRNELYETSLNDMTFRDHMVPGPGKLP
ncbi:cytochrome P450 [Hymenopellis radicata]|nr:cytochrome P450 [Hymenopellis radicata]